MNFDLGYLIGLILNIYFFVALLIVMLLLFILSYRYKILLKYSAEKISLLHSFFVTNVSNFLSYISPFRVGTVLVKPVTTKFFSKIPIKKSTFVAIFEQIFEIGWEIIILLISLIFIGEKFLFNNLFLKIIIFFLFVSMLVVGLLNHEKIISFLWKFKNFLPKKIRKFGKKAGLGKENVKEIMNEALKYSLNLGVLLKLFLITLPFVLISPLIIMVLANIFSMSISYPTAFVVYWVSVVVGRLSSIPGGFGSREATMAGLLIAFGVASGVSLKIMLLSRIVALIPAIIIGGLLTLYMSSKIPFKKLIGKYTSSHD